MKSFKCLFLVLFGLISCLHLQAYDFEKDGIYYNIYYGNAEVAPGEQKYKGDFVVPDSVIYKGRRYAVKRITTNSFAYCTDLTSIDLNLVDFIGYCAFKGCTGLKSVDLKNVKTLGFGPFMDCTGLEDVDFRGVRDIGESSFSVCNNLREIDLKEVKYIYDDAFSNCTGIHTVDLYKDNHFGESVFRGCKGLKTIHCNDVTKLCDGLFSNCEGLDSMVSERIDSIGRYCFSGCKNIKTAKFPNLKYMGESAFSGCSSLKTVDIGKIETIPMNSFDNCTALESFDFKNVKLVSSLAFYNCSNLQSLDLKNVETIGNMVFYDCKKLKSIDFGRVSLIAGGSKRFFYGAFSGCDSIEFVRLSHSIPTIDDGFYEIIYPFDDCVYSQATLYVSPFLMESLPSSYPWNRFKEQVAEGYLLKIACNEGGSISFAQQTVSDTTLKIGVFPDDKYTFRITVDPGYDLKSVQVNGKEMVDEIINNTFSCSFDQFLTSIVVTFQKKSLLLDDSIPYQNTKELMYSEIVYSRNFETTDWQAFYVPFAMNYSDWSAHYQMARLEDTHHYDDDRDGVIDRIVLEAVVIPEGGETKANVPYIIKPKACGLQQLVTKDNVLRLPEEFELDCTSWSTRYIFRGTYQGIPAEESQYHEIYTLENGLLSVNSDPQSLGSYRWYLTIEGRQGNSAPSLKNILLRVLDECGNVVGIQSIQDNQLSPRHHDGKIYDLMGRRLNTFEGKASSLPQGIYLMNGKKYLKTR